MGSISPFLQRNCRDFCLNKFLGKNWAAFPPEIKAKFVRSNCIKKFLGKNWAAFPPIFNATCGDLCLTKFLGKNWAAFPPEIKAKFVKSNCIKKFLGKNWASFPPIFNATCKIELYQKISWKKLGSIAPLDTKKIRQLFLENDPKKKNYLRQGRPVLELALVGWWCVIFPLPAPTPAPLPSKPPTLFFRPLVGDEDGNR